jgi:hypothetical protein
MITFFKNVGLGIASAYTAFTGAFIPIQVPPTTPVTIQEATTTSPILIVATTSMKIGTPLVKINHVTSPAINTTVQATPTKPSIQVEYENAKNMINNHKASLSTFTIEATSIKNKAETYANKADSNKEEELNGALSDLSQITLNLLSSYSRLSNSNVTVLDEINAQYNSGKLDYPTSLSFFAQTTEKNAGYIKAGEKELNDLENAFDNTVELVKGKKESSKSMDYSYIPTYPAPSNPLLSSQDDTVPMQFIQPKKKIEVTCLGSNISGLGMINCTAQ